MAVVKGMKYYRSLPKKRMATGVVFRDNKDRILMVKPVYKDHWTLPGGVVEKDESPKRAGEREVKEEIGLDIEIERFMGVIYVGPDKEKNESLQWLFYGGILSDFQSEKIKLDSNELENFKWVDLQDMLKMIGPVSKDKLDLIQKLINSSEALYLESHEET